MSTVTARVEDAQRYRELLIEQLTAPVKFTQAARELVNQGVTTFVEVGPGNVLGGLLKRIDRSVRILSVNDLKSLDEATGAKKDERIFLRADKSVPYGRVAELIGHCEGILVWLVSKSAQPHDGPGIDRIRSFRRRPDEL